jgi:PBSX family phage terminase large subunit
MQFADVQAESMLLSTSRINLWTGPVRSGKTISTCARFADFIQREQHRGEFYLIGKTVHTLKRNVIGPMEEMLGDDFHYYSGKGEIKLWDRTIHVVGANDAKSEGKIRGSTSAGTLIDEGSLVPQDMFRMALSRMSVPNAKMFVTTNPDGPKHWLKTDFIDRRSELNMSVFHWGLDDVDFLDPQFVADLKAEYTGLWYKRFILGEWVMAEGAIYDMFNDDDHTFSTYPDIVPDEYIVGVDYGTTNPCVFVLIGIKWADARKKRRAYAWAEREYYYDSEKKLRQKTDSQYADDMANFLSARQHRDTVVSSIYIDPSAASFKLELKKSGLHQIKDADNDVANGIRTVSRMLHQRRYSLHSLACSHTVGEYSSYVWDQKKAEHGDEQPVKSGDHGKDAERYALHSYFGQDSVIYDAQSMRS